MILCPIHHGIYNDMLLTAESGAEYRVQFWHAKGDVVLPELVDLHSMATTMSTLTAVAAQLEAGELWPSRHPWLPTDKWLLWERNLDSLMRKEFRKQMQELWEEKGMRRAA
jgi:hypothetical protein